MRGVWRTGGGHWLRGGSGKRLEEVSSGRPQSLRYQRRPVDDCSPGQRGMTEDGGTRSGTVHCESDC